MFKKSVLFLVLVAHAAYPITTQKEQEPSIAVTRSKSESVTVQIPAKEALKKCLRDKGLNYFDEKTKFSEKNGDRSLNSFGVLMAAQLAFYDFAKKFEGHPQEEAILAATYLNLDMLFECMAGHSPQAMQEINELKEKIHSGK